MIPQNINISETGMVYLLETISDKLIKSEIKNDSFSYGRSSAALFSLYYGYHFNQEAHLYHGVNLIEEVIENIVSGQTTFSGGELYSGFAGFMATINNLKKNDILDIDLEQFQPIEKILFQWSIEQLNQKNTDFFSGVSGSLNFFIHRLDTTEKEQSSYHRILGYINEILTRLEKQVIVAQNGQSFLRNKYYINANKEKKGAVNYGIAHGTSSIIINLLLLKKKGLLNQGLQIKLDELIQTIFYLRRKYNPGHPYYFVSQYNIYDNATDFQNRIGWCYSDLNIIHLLALDQKISDHKDFQEEIDACTSLLLSRTSFNENRLEDPFFCHGYSGVAEYFRMLQDLTNKIEYKEGYTWALKKSLTFYSPSIKFPVKKNSNSFFYGDLGVGFVLMNALKPKCATWNEIVLL